MTDKIPALIIALCVYVTTRLSGMPLTQDTLNAYKKGALAVLDLPEFAADNGGIEKIRAADIEDWMWQLSEKGWMDHKWYQKVPIGDDPALLAREISGAVDEGLDFDDEDDDDDMDMDIDEDDGTVVVATTTTTTIAADKGWNETSSSRKATSTPLGGLDTMVSILSIHPSSYSSSIKLREKQFNTLTNIISFFFLLLCITSRYNQKWITCPRRNEPNI